MITPEYLDEVIKQTEQTVSDVNAIIILKIARKLYEQYLENGELELMPSTIKQFHALMDTGLVSENIEYELTQMFPEIQKDIHKAFLDSAGEMAKTQQDVARNIIKVDNLDIPFESIPEQQNVIKKASDLMLTPTQLVMLENAYKRTNKTIKNICHTAAKCTEIEFKDMCDNLYLEYRQGGKSMDELIHEAIKQFGKKGIVVQYGNKETNIEVATARALRTSINQTNAEMVLQGNAEMGVGWVKVSEHLGARVTNTEDYRDHSWWQGKVYSLDWSKPELADYEPSNRLPDKMQYIANIKNATEKKKAENYPDFVETCGYGDILGICGVNCRHSFHAWYPGINIDRGPRVDAAENKKRYAAEQKARAYERKIRELKREFEATKCFSDAEGKTEHKEIKSRLDTFCIEYRDFCKVNKITVANWRIEI